MGAFLREHRDEVMREWEALVGQEPRDVKLTRLALRDDLPALLEELAAWLDQGEAPSTSRMRAAAARHAAQRLEHSYQLTQLIHEFRLLRATILRALLDVEATLKERGGSERIAERVVDLARLNAGLDFAIMDAVEIFVEEREHRLLTDVRDDARKGLERSEERFRALIEKSTDMILMIDAEARYQFWSPSATLALGWTAEEVLGRSVFDFIHADDRARIEEALRGVLRSAGATARALMRYQHKDGSYREIEADAHNLLDDPAVLAVVVNSRDVTAHRSLEEQFRQAQRLESVGRLAGGIAHDFNNVLSVILSCTEFALKRLREGDPLRIDLLDIEKAGRRAETLTRQLLAFSRKQVLQPEPLDLNRNLAELDKMLRRIIGEDIELVLGLAHDLGIIMADPSQVEQVIMNLVVNARDAMPEGGKLTIETANVELDAEYAAQHVGSQPGAHVMLAVSDTGTGMDEKTRARAFEPFFTTKAPGKGSGLGLATVYGIVKQSGGSIYLYSEAGKGTTFKIYLPRELTLTPITRASLPVASTGGTETILVVEDDEAVRSVAKRILEAAGYTTLTAAEGAEGLLICERYPAAIDLVLTDVLMPVMGGRAFVERLITIRPGTKVLYMSGYTDNAIVHQGHLEPGTPFINKPLTQSELLRKIREVLSG
jgi:PAS domain S-box-containing protein